MGGSGKTSAKIDRMNTTSKLGILGASFIIKSLMEISTAEIIVKMIPRKPSNFALQDGFVIPVAVSFGFSIVDKI